MTPPHSPTPAQIATARASLALYDWHTPPYATGKEPERILSSDHMTQQEIDEVRAALKVLDLPFSETAENTNTLIISGTNNVLSFGRHHSAGLSMLDAELAEKYPINKWQVEQAEPNSNMRWVHVVTATPEESRRLQRILAHGQDAKHFIFSQSAYSGKEHFVRVPNKCDASEINQTTVHYQFSPIDERLSHGEKILANRALRPASPGTHKRV